MYLLTVMVVAYLLGSIPFGLVFAKLMGAGDLRAIGSGNIGATNALRTGNKKLAIFTLLCDLLKGTLAVLVSYQIYPEIAPLAGIVAVLGHVFPIWLRFKGGKGVATGFGILLGLAPWVFLAAIATWGGVFYYKRISSLSALVAYSLAPMYALYGGDNTLALSLLVLASIIFITHRDNISRLARGQEKQFASKPDA